MREVCGIRYQTQREQDTFRFLELLEVVDYQVHELFKEQECESVH